MTGRVSRMLLEAAGARPRAPRRASGDVVIYDRATGGFRTMPAPERITRWNEDLGGFETIDAWWDEATQTYIPVHGACIPAAESSGIARNGAWSPADEARRLARESPKESDKTGGK